jgi:hypothetical protein
MDSARARDVALAEFARRDPAPKAWDVTGPAEEIIQDLDSPAPFLVFTFRPRPEHNADGRLFPLKVAVDPRTGEADMLR